MSISKLILLTYTGLVSDSWSTRVSVSFSLDLQNKTFILTSLHFNQQLLEFYLSCKFNTNYKNRYEIRIFTH